MSTHSKQAILLGIFLAVSFFYSHALASDISLPTVLKADKIDGNQASGIVKAVGNVEISKDGNTLFANKLSSSKDQELIKAEGHVKIKNYSIGNLLAESAKTASNLETGEFSDATIIFNDGSYIQSPKINRISKDKTILTTPTLSICPNWKIGKNNLLAGKNSEPISIKSKITTIDKTSNSVKVKGGTLRFYDFPFFYTPYLKLPIPSSNRKSGFLTPSYINSTKLGTGFRIPYYLNIAPNKDLKTTIQTHPSKGHLLLENHYRHLLKEGEYSVNFNLANNEPKETNLVNSYDPEITKSVRWEGKAKGQFILPKNFGIDFDINNVGDKDYLRDYQNNFIGHTVSQVNLDYIKNRDYFSIKTVKIQELEVNQDSEESPFAMPIVNYYKESAPQGGLLNQTYSVLGNATVITRDSGPQYRRFSVIPKISIPYNVGGSLFKVSASAQGDFYNLKNNYTTSARDNDLDSTELNYRPEINFKWSYPLIRKSLKNTIIFEPLLTATTSKSSKNYEEMPNEDTNNGELTQSNLFLSDRLSGFDRNELGSRVNYGFKSSLFNDFGNFNLGLGQSYKNDNKEQDVSIRGFNGGNKSNIVGELSYISKEIFNIVYNFQLNESNYRNDINDLSASIKFDKVRFGSNYILIRNYDSQSGLKREQVNFRVDFDITKKLVSNFRVVRDLVTKRNIIKRYGLMYNGCCMNYGIEFSETSPSDFIRAEKSYNIIFTIKNL
jgi:LPS-assembly protein